jgi:hypothetical protein
MLDIFPDYELDYEINNDFQFSNSFIHEFKGDSNEISSIQLDHSYLKDCDNDSISDMFKIYINKTPDENINEKIDEVKNNEEDFTENNQSQICDENYFDHIIEGSLEQKSFECSKIYPDDKKFYSPLEINNEFEEGILDINNKLSKEDNRLKDNNQIFLIERNILCDQEFPEEKAKEKNKGIFSLENDKIKNQIDIQRNTINQKLFSKNSCIFPIHNDNEVNNFIQQNSFNFSQINQNSNMPRIHNNGEIDSDIRQKSINSKQTSKNSISNGSTGDSTQKNNPNISIMNKYKYPFVIIQPQENLISSNMKLNMSSENLYINFKRKRRSVREEVKKHKLIKKAEDLEKPNLRKFKGYLRYKKKNNIKEFTEVFDKDRNFWDPFLKNSQPFKFTKNGKEFVFKSYSTSLMNFIFSREDVNDLYEKFLSDKIYIEKILQSLDDKSEGYKQAYLISLKNFSKKYNKNYKEGDLELGLEEFY